MANFASIFGLKPKSNDTPSVNLTPLRVTSNGTYHPGEYDGFSEVTVEVANESTVEEYDGNIIIEDIYDFIVNVGDGIDIPVKPQSGQEMVFHPSGILDGGYDDGGEWYVYSIASGVCTIYINSDADEPDHVYTVKVLESEEPSEPSLPEWNGTDLTGTTWYIPSGWSATAGYGTFYVDAEGHPDDGVYFSVSAASDGFGIGKLFDMDSLGYINRADRVGVPYMCDILNTTGFTITFSGGTDATNTSLISWLKTNGTLTSHSMPTITLISFTIDGTTYQAEEGMTWGEWAESDYNTGGYADNGAYIAPNGEIARYVQNTNRSGVKASDLILANGVYIVSSGGGAD